MEEKHKITDEHMKEKTFEAVDEIAESVKNATRKIFDVCVERTAEVFSNLLDTATDKAKKKMAEKGNANETEESTVQTDGGTG